MDDKAEWIAERAAIMEHDGKIPRELAERLARKDWERTHPAGPRASGPIRAVIAGASMAILALAAMCQTVFPAGTADPAQWALPGAYQEACAIVDAVVAGNTGQDRLGFTLEMADASPVPVAFGIPCSVWSGQVYVFVFASTGSDPLAPFVEFVVDPNIYFPAWPRPIPRWFSINSALSAGAWVQVSGLAQWVGWTVHTQSIWFIPNGQGAFALVASAAKDYVIQ